MSSAGAAPDSGVASVETTSLLRGSSALLVGRVINVMLTLGIQVLLVRSLTRAEFGAFGYALTVAGMGMVVVTLGTNKAVPRFLAIFDEEDDRERFAGTLVFELFLILGLGLALFVLWIGGRALLEQQFSQDPLVLTLTTILIVTVPQDGIDRVLEAFAAVTKHTRVILIRKYLLEPTLRLIAVLVLIAAHASVEFLALAYVIAGLIGTAAYVQLLTRQLRSDGRLRDLRTGHRHMPVRPILRYSAPLLLHDMVFASMPFVAVLLIGRWQGIEEVADYRAVFNVSRMNQIVAWTFAVLYLPLAGRLFARGDIAGMRIAYWRSASMLCVLTLPLFLITGPFARALTVTLFGSEYSSASSAMAVLSIGFYVNTAIGFSFQTLQNFGRLRFIVALDLVAFGILLLLSFVLIPPLGALGAATAAAVAMVAINVIAQFGIHQLGLKYFDAAYARVYATVVAAVVICLAVEILLTPSFLVAAGVVVLISVAVIAATMGSLGLVEIIPEISRLPGYRKIRR